MVENESEMNDWNVTTEPGRASETTEMRELAASLKKKDTTGFPTQRFLGFLLGTRERTTCQNKHIEVYPAKRLSEQLHQHCSEHWVALQETAKATIDGTEQIVQPDESVFIPANARHRLENVGKIPV